MAIYHCSIKTFSRAKGETVVAAAAYRARAKLENEFLGRQENYSKRKDLAHTEIILPANAPAWAKDAGKLWNAVEKKETRKNSTVAREFEIALPHELNEQQRQKLAHDISQKLVDRFGFAVQYSIHKPANGEGVNHHVHILASTRKLDASGFTDKTRELDDIKSNTVEQVREMVGNTINGHLKAAGRSETVSHKSLADQQVDALAAGDLKKAAELNRAPTVHIGKHPIQSLANTAHNEQIITANIESKREMVDLLKSTVNPIEIRKEAVQTLRTHYQAKLQNLQQGVKPSPVQGSARTGATAGADARKINPDKPQQGTGPILGGGEISVDVDVAALTSQIGDIELQMSLMPPPRTAQDFQRRNELSARISKLKDRLKDVLARKDASKSRGTVNQAQAGPSFKTAGDYFQQKAAAQKMPEEPHAKKLAADKKRDQAKVHVERAKRLEDAAKFSSGVGASEFRTKAWMEKAKAQKLEQEARELEQVSKHQQTAEQAKKLDYKPPWADKNKGEEKQR